MQLPYGKLFTHKYDPLFTKEYL